jgi:hypothetical protein
MPLNDRERSSLTFHGCRWIADSWLYLAKKQFRTRLSVRFQRCAVTSHGWRAAAPTCSLFAPLG